MRPGTRGVLGGVLVLATALAGSAAAQLADRQWLPAGSRLEAALSTVPAEPRGGGASDLLRLGELAFLAPQTLGGKARRLGLSCAACHPGGGSNTGFFLPGLSDRPGNVDLTSGFFDPGSDDGIDNPRNIPVLHGAAATPPYGHDGGIADLRDFSRHVIADEFARPSVPAWLLDALAAYLRDLRFNHRVRLDAAGRLPADAPAAARRGEAVFTRPFSATDPRSCASCHPPGQAFTDRRAHDLGDGRFVDTPSLYALAASPPYFHDGRFADLESVVDERAGRFGFTLTAEARSDLLAYLSLIGETLPARPVTLAGDLARILRLQPVLSGWDHRGRRERTLFAASALRHLLGRIAERFPGEEGAPARAILIAWSRELGDFAAALETDEEFAARDRLAGLLGRSDGRRRMLLALEPVSLYRPERLRAALAATAGR